MPAFLALVAEPLFLLADAAIVGHLGTPELAGLGIAGAVVQTAVGLCVFLAYGTTASVARRVGAGDVRGALAQGVDGVWLAVLIGVRRPRSPAVPLAASAGRAVRARARRRPTTPRRTCGWPSSASPRCWSCWPRPGCCAGCRTPGPRWSSRWSATCANIVLNLLLVYGLDLGIAGSALGTDLAQLGSAAALRRRRGPRRPPRGCLAAPGPAPACVAPRTPASPSWSGR